ncbi:MAG TPA: hypothetical protein VLI41_05935 [Phenylobacterium sp.]|uniref:hypothetical protein n=1 Tax=Phenylobacterium sp. TaxID=1871053 RepID=UPI002C71CB44|nr:hypothetical protein [Phenylobacterium sp.]HSV02728.1 hypothetical protein [Phenylobacterium sp.]
MKVAAIALTVVSFAIAGTAAASSRVTDLDYLKANRCKGLAVGMGSADTTGLDAFIKAEGRSRDPIILSRAEEELHRAQRQAKDANLKDKLSAELAGPCMAYMTGGGSPATSR